jgi:hypothetical protein
MSRVDHYLGHVQDVLGTLPAYLRAQVQGVVGDAYYSKKTFVDGVIRAGFAFVGKLRVDANLKYKYIGPRTGKPGRPKRFDGKVEMRRHHRRWRIHVAGATTSPTPRPADLRLHHHCWHHLFVPALHLELDSAPAGWTGHDRLSAVIARHSVRAAWTRRPEYWLGHGLFCARWTVRVDPAISAVHQRISGEQETALNCTVF